MAKPTIIISQQDLQRLETMLEHQSKLSPTMQHLEDELAKFNIKYYSGSQLFEYSGTTDIRFIPPLDGFLD